MDASLQAHRTRAGGAEVQGRKSPRRNAADGAALESFRLHAKRGGDRPCEYRMKARMTTSAGASVCALTVAIYLCAVRFAASAGEVTITLPPETVSLRPGPYLDVAQANCTACHSADYLSIQPPMPRKFWEAE